jgi:hypothetical protein
VTWAASRPGGPWENFSSHDVISWLSLTRQYYAIVR